MDWETVMTSYDARNNVEMAFDIFKSEPDGRRGRTGDPVRARGRLFIKFLALMIRVRMQRIVSASGIEVLTVENMLLSAGTYKIVDDKGYACVRNVPNAYARYSPCSVWTTPISCLSRNPRNDVAQSREFRLMGRCSNASHNCRLS